MTGGGEVDMKYRALRCNIASLADEDPEEFNRIKQVVVSSQADNKRQDIRVADVFRVRKEEEYQIFLSSNAQKENTKYSYLSRSTYLYSYLVIIILGCYFMVRGSAIGLVY